MPIEKRFGLLLASVMLAATGFAQQEALPPVPKNDKIVLDVVVTPKNGKPVATLTQGQFTLLDNKTPRPITSFKPVVGSEAQVEVILLIDAVNTGYQSVAYERQEIDKFLKANGGQLAQPTTLAVFTDTSTQIQPTFTKDGNSLAESLDKLTIGLRDIRRSAGFYGATDRLDMSMKALGELAAREGPRPGRKILLWVSPGWPLLSGPGVQLDQKQQNGIFAQVVSLSTQLRRAHITLYNVDPIGASESVLRTSYYQQFVKGISKPSQVDLGDLGLQVLAAQTGGLVLNANNDITGQLQKVMDDTAAYYEMSFDPAPSDQANEFHQIQVQVAQPGLVARTRNGYYSQP